ncbi:MAG: acyl-CoA dehydrogenase [Oligoflexia bacterium]|nr:acyl-CoA dehydrogenase [Oligoflexia bacterium]
MLDASFLNMSCGLLIALSLGLVFCLGFLGAPIFLWTLGAAIILFLAGVGNAIWIVFALIAVVANVRPIRALLISSVIMKIFKIMEFVPTISETERTAIEAGVVWVEGELFSGKPNFKKILAEPYPELSAEEKAFIDGPTEKLCEIIDDWRIWQDREIPNHVWDFMKKEKFLGMIIPKEYGGLGFSALCHSEVVKKVSSRSLPVGISVMVPNSLGPAELLVHYGTQAQKDKYLRRLANGEEMPCFALTEPGAGSDAGSLLSTGEIMKASDGSIQVKLNWEKRWITLAAISTVLGLAVRLRDPQNILGKGEDLGITCLLIPSNTPGVVLGKRHDPLGVPFYNCPTRGKDVIVPAEECIIGGIEGGAGKGWKMLMECLGAGRGISLPAQSTGGAQLCAQLSSAHSAVRKQFGMPIGKFEGVEEHLARIAGSAYLLEASRRYTCGAIDKGIKPPVITAIAKYCSTEIMRKCVNDAMDILGGAGITRGPKNTLAHGYISIPIGITVEGANILTRTLMIFGQGALRAHPYAFAEVKALEENSLSGFDKAFWGHIGHVVRNLFRSIGLSLSRGRLSMAPSGAGPLAVYYKKLAWASASFAILADVAMGVLGGKLKQKEMLTGRFADALSWMYLASATLRRWDAEGRRKEDLPYAKYALEMALGNIQSSFDGIFSNFQIPGATWIFRAIFGQWSRLNRFSAGPSDAQAQKLARLIQTPCEQRTRVIDGIYLSKDPENDHRAQLEKALITVKSAEEIERKVKRAVREKKIAKIKGAKLFQEALAKGVINQAEFESLDKAEKLRWASIQVDEFTLEEYKNRA